VRSSLPPRLATSISCAGCSRRSRACRSRSRTWSPSVVGAVGDASGYASRVATKRTSEERALGVARVAVTGRFRKSSHRASREDIDDLAANAVLRILARDGQDALSAPDWETKLARVAEDQARASVRRGERRAGGPKEKKARATKPRLSGKELRAEVHAAAEAEFLASTGERVATLVRRSGGVRRQHADERAARAALNDAGTALAKLLKLAESTATGEALSIIRANLGSIRGAAGMPWGGGDFDTTPQADRGASVWRLFEADVLGLGRPLTDRELALATLCALDDPGRWKKAQTVAEAIAAEIRANRHILHGADFETYR
jgi:hypothetical protein